MTTKVKICGLTTLRDAVAAADAGADAIGFVFAGGPRHLRPDVARRISRALPAFVHRVGVFANASVSDIALIARTVGLSWAQLHGDESPAYARSLTVPWVKVFHVSDGRVLARVKRFGTDLIHLDTQAGGRRGGTGKTFDWGIARSASKLGRVILAGGLTPENVAEAVRVARPFAVDVASGVEASPGKKDPRKVRRFIEEARSA